MGGQDARHRVPVKGASITWADNSVLGFTNPLPPSPWPTDIRDSPWHEASTPQVLVMVLRVSRGLIATTRGAQHAALDTGQEACALFTLRNLAPFCWGTGYPVLLDIVRDTGFARAGGGVRWYEQQTDERAKGGGYVRDATRIREGLRGYKTRDWPRARVC